MLWIAAFTAYAMILLALLGSLAGVAISLAMHLMALGVMILVGISAYKWATDTSDPKSDPKSDEDK